MVNTGKPSDACFECKRRRIKCDAALPQCARCIKHKVKCPGYPDKASFKFRDESTKLKRKNGKRSKAGGKSIKQVVDVDESLLLDLEGDESSTETLVDDTSEKTEGLKSAPRQRSYERTLSIPQVSVGNAMTQGAISAFMSQWIYPDPDIYWATFDGAALLYPTAHQSHCYTSALEAVSLMTLSCGDKKQNTDLRRPAMKAYGRSLGMINRALEDPSQRAIDHTFMAIELIILFELLESGLHSEFVGPRYGSMGDFNHQVDRVLMHLRGIMAVVSIRGPEQFAESLGRRLFLTACVLWNLGSVSMPEPIPIPLTAKTWEGLFQYDLGKYRDTYYLLRLQDRAVTIRREAVQKFNTNLDLGEVIELLRSIRAVDDELKAWYSGIPAEWTARTDMYALFTINLYRSYRIFMQDLLVRCYQVMRNLDFRDYHDEIVLSTRTTKRLLNEICASTPYNFAGDDPRQRTDLVMDPVIPKQGLTVVFHLMYSFPLLVASMVAPISEVQNKGIEEARLECARACGLIRPIRSFPRTLLQGVEVNAGE